MSRSQTVGDADLEPLLRRPLTPPAPETAASIEAGPIDPGDALSLTRIDRLLDPAPLRAETGWCLLPDACGYVAVRTAMPGVSGEMADWWFDWHQRDDLRYRVWHPRAHSANSGEPPAGNGRPGAKAHWGAVHHPVEDVGTGMVRARIEFRRPTELGFSTDALHDPNVATVVCGFAGDDTRRIRHTPMAHVFLNEGGGGVVLRSRFWLGAALRPYLPGVLGDALGRAINRPAVRRRSLPPELPKLLARHCAEEFANLAALLPGLYAAHGPAGRESDV